MAGRDDEIDAAVAWYYAEAEVGRPPGRAEFLARYPDLRPELESFLHDKAAFDRAAGPPDPDATVAPEDGGGTVTFPPGGDADPRDPGPPLGVVRYVGDYELLAELARGGMGVVFKARQVSLNREVAVKMILSGALATPADVRRFRAEAEAAANLDHPHVLPIYEVGEHAGQQYFSMKLVPGGSLADKLGGTPAADAKGFVSLFAKVCRAVHFAHQRGILHRDLKPANVLLDADGTPYVTDFGLAKKTGDSSSTQTGAVVGTPSYMPPEQARGDKGLTVAADVYSLGAVLYEALAGRPPFKGPTVLDTLLQVMDEEPAPPQRHHPAADRDLSVIALKCLAKDPGKRYASAADLADDLDRWLRGEPIHARPATRAEKAAKWVRRNPAVAALATAAVLLLVTGTAVSLYYAALADERAERAKLNEEIAQVNAATAADMAVAARTAETAALDAAGREADQRKAAERLLYFNRIALAQQYLRADDADQAEKLLSAAPAETRGWEWHYLDRLRRPELLRLPGNGQFTTGLSFSKDGKRMAAVAQTGDCGVRVWDLTTNKPVCDIALFATLRSFNSGVITPDGKHVVLGERGGAVTLYDATTGKFVKVLGQLPAAVSGLDVSPDGARVLAASGSALKDPAWKMWELPSGKELPTPPGVKYAVAFAPNGMLLGFKKNPDRAIRSSVQQTVGVLYAADGKEVHTIGPMMSWAFDPGGEFLAVGGYDSNANPQLRVLHDPAGKDWWAGDAYWSVSLPYLGDLAFSPDGKFLVSFTKFGRPLDVWDTSSGRKLRTLRGHTGFVNAVAFAPDGRLASCSWDSTIRFWDVTADQEFKRLPGQGAEAPSGAAVHPRGESAAFVQGDRMGTAFLASLLIGDASAPVFVWDAATGKTRRVFGHDRATNRVAYSAGGSRLISGDQTGRVLVSDLATGAKLGSFRHPGKVEAVALSPDGAVAVSAHEPEAVTKSRIGNNPGLQKPVSGGAKVWDAATGKELFALGGHDWAVYQAVFSPDGRTLATVSPKQLRLWDAATWQLRREVRDDNVIASGLAFSPDGGTVTTVGYDKVGLVFWDAATGARRGDVPQPAGNNFNAVAFTPDGRRVVTAFRRAVTVWDAATRQEILSLPLPPGETWVIALGFDPAGRLLAAMHDGTVIAWDGRPAGK